MSGLSFVFFCVAPFALFCSEDGNGMILCAIYLILGSLCKWIENGGLKPKVYIEPKDWWECNYRQNMAQGRGHKASKSIADFTTKSNHFPMPSEHCRNEPGEWNNRTSYQIFVLPVPRRLKNNIQPCQA